ncbi:SGNH/GDSL hydrolase family protein [Ruegeria arenilitoris]|uniref:SGNH/GDSL hydrolase family protein n=1 Tax=Ruegeria arenilitoris TaxID=1173585 RepID=UPI00147B7E1E|nr:SGNH/GDSL hydrolase family protein [Ruegeria arenilitoris]
MDADRILRIPLLPVLAVQALHVRRNAQQLPEPIGPRKGRQGHGPRLRLLIAGDSSAAGVGVDYQSQALSGQLVSRLARQYCVEWRLEATTGHTTQDTLKRLQNLDATFDVVVTALGVNDVTRLVSQRKFANLQTRLLNHLSKKLGARHVVVTAVPRMERFPALPQPLAWVLGRQSSRLDQSLQCLIKDFPRALHLPLDFPDDPTLAAADGYHPSPKAYQLWAEAVANLLRQA